jgi:hypothetical protein
VADLTFVIQLSITNTGINMVTPHTTSIHSNILEFDFCQLKVLEVQKFTKDYVHSSLVMFSLLIWVSALTILHE